MLKYASKAKCGKSVELKRKSSESEALNTIMVRQKGLEQYSLECAIKALQIPDFNGVYVYSSCVFEESFRSAESRINTLRFFRYMWKIRGVKSTDFTFLKPKNLIAGLFASLSQIYLKITVQKKRGSYGENQY